MRNCCENHTTMHQKSIKIRWKSDQNPSKSIQNRPLERDPEKTRKIMKKVMLGIAVRSRHWGPKIDQNGIQKSWKNKHRKNIPKWYPKVRKGMENGAKMGPNIIKKSIYISIPKMNRKNIEKTRTNETVEPWKTMFFLRKSIHFTKIALPRVIRKGHPKNH